MNEVKKKPITPAMLKRIGYIRDNRLKDVNCNNKMC